jgi:predicted RNase H-like HicB family nuclease
MKYKFVLEKVNQNYVAYVPDLPGCVASGKTADETRKAMKETVDMHLKGLVADGLPIPIPIVKADYFSADEPADPAPPVQSKIRKLFGF